MGGWYNGKGEEFCFAENVNIRRMLMECLKCGAVVADEGAVYCCECGARLDGKKACPECGQFIDEKYTFCVFCGARVDGKSKCTNCNAYHEGAFCPDCGESLTAVKPVHKKAENKSAAAREVAVTQENGAVWASVFAWIRAGLGILNRLESTGKRFKRSSCAGRYGYYRSGYQAVLLLRRRL